MYLLTRVCMHRLALSSGGDALLTASTVLFAVWHGEGQDHGAQAAEGAQESYEEGAQPASSLLLPPAQPAASIR